MKLWILDRLEALFMGLADWAYNMQENCSYCHTCGRNRYNGKPCVGTEPHD